MRRGALGWYVTAGVVLFVIVVLAPPLVKAVAVAVAAAAGGAAVLYGLRVYRPARPLGWRILAAGTVMVGMPHICEQLLLAGRAPSAILAVGNTMGTLGFFACVVGPLLLVRARAGSGDRDGLIDGTILALALAVALQQWLGVLQTGAVLNVPAEVLGVMTIVSASALAAGIRLVFLAPRLPSAWLIKTASLLSVLIGLAAVAATGPGAAHAVYILSVIATWANGAAALPASMAHLTVPARQQDRLPYARLLVLGAALFGTTVAVFAEAGVRVAHSFAAISSLLVTALVLLRILRLVADRERARQALDSREAQQALVARLGERALTDASVAELFTQATAALQVTLHVDVAAVLEFAAETSTLHLHTAVGWPDEAPSAMAASPLLYETAVGRPQNSILESWHPGRHRAGSNIAVALTGPHGVVGLLAIHRDGSGPFTSDERTCLQSVAAVLSSGIQRRRSEAEVRHQALHDILTGLPNRTLLLQRMEPALGGRPYDDSVLAVLFIDLDGFKNVNDTLGHQAGDHLLVEVAARLGALLGECDTLSRISGDEFVAVCFALPDAVAAQSVAGHITAALSEPFVLPAGLATIGASVGVALWSGTETAEELVQNADTAMYRAKHQLGKSGFMVFDESLRAQAERSRNLERALRDAPARGELYVVWQPIADLEDGRIVAAEALARWAHPTYGELSPVEFIPIAERVGAIGELGGWVLRQACRQLVEWRAVAGEEFVGFVNVSPLQIADPAFADTALAILRETGLKPSSLGLEITETAAMQDVDDACATLRLLRDQGVRIALDDFGSGYSSLAYLQRLPIDVVKLDKSLVQPAGAGISHDAVIASVVAMAGALGFTVLAEGIEDAAQHASAQRLGCQLGQGFQLARPMLPERMEALLQTGLPLGRARTVTTAG